MAQKTPKVNAAELERLRAIEKWAMNAHGWIGAILQDGGLAGDLERQLRRVWENADPAVKGLPVSSENCTSHQ